MKKQDQKHYGVVYCVTNKSNNKKYIGQTTRPFNHRIYQHKRSAKYGGERGKCTALRNALIKYGEDNFNWDIIAYGANQQDLNDLDTISGTAEKAESIHKKRVRTFQETKRAGNYQRKQRQRYPSQQKRDSPQSLGLQTISLQGKDNPYQ